MARGQTDMSWSLNFRNARYGTETSTAALCWCATATRSRSRARHWLYVQIPPWNKVTIRVMIRFGVLYFRFLIGIIPNYFLCTTLQLWISSQGLPNNICHLFHLVLDFSFSCRSRCDFKDVVDLYHVSVSAVMVIFIITQFAQPWAPVFMFWLNVVLQNNFWSGTCCQNMFKLRPEFVTKIFQAILL